MIFGADAEHVAIAADGPRKIRRQKKKIVIEMQASSKYLLLFPISI